MSTFRALTLHTWSLFSILSEGSCAVSRRVHATMSWVFKVSVCIWQWYLSFQSHGIPRSGNIEPWACCTQDRVLSSTAGPVGGSRRQSEGPCSKPWLWQSSWEQHLAPCKMGGLDHGLCGHFWFCHSKFLILGGLLPWDRFQVLATAGRPWDVGPSEF